MIYCEGRHPNVTRSVRSTSVDPVHRRPRVRVTSCDSHPHTTDGTSPRLCCHQIYSVVGQRRCFCRALSVASGHVSRQLHSPPKFPPVTGLLHRPQLSASFVVALHVPRLANGGKIHVRSILPKEDERGDLLRSRLRGEQTQIRVNEQRGRPTDKRDRGRRLMSASWAVVSPEGDDHDCVSWPLSDIVHHPHHLSPGGRTHSPGRMPQLHRLLRTLRGLFRARGCPSVVGEVPETPHPEIAFYRVVLVGDGIVICLLLFGRAPSPHAVSSAHSEIPVRNGHSRGRPRHTRRCVCSSLECGSVALAHVVCVDAAGAGHIRPICPRGLVHIVPAARGGGRRDIRSGRCRSAHFGASYRTETVRSTGCGPCHSLYLKLPKQYKVSFSLIPGQPSPAFPRK
jgi:hypothetical protein